ncbi:MAG: ATP-binding protein, partial [Acidimicrobiales bacterium]
RGAVPAGKRILLTSSALGPIVVAAGPIRDGERQIASLGVATLARTLVDRLGKPEGTTVALFDPRGTMVAASGPVPPLEPSAAAGGGQIRLQAGGREVLIGSIVGRGEVVARIAVFREPGSLLDELGMTPAWLAVLGMLALLGVVGLGLVVAKTITAPLDRVATTVRGIAEGDLSRRAEVRSADEVGTLGRAFNAMADRLQESYEVLERRVRERTAQLQAANAELAGLAQAKSDFLASISHELRTPLNAVLGYSEILTDPYFPSPGEEEVQRYAGAIHESGRHLLNLINDLLDLSKIEAGKLELHFEEVDVAAGVDEVLRVMEPLAASKCLLVSSDLYEAPEVVVADGRRLRQILLNLLSNAVKFTPEGGSVGLRVASDGRDLLVSVTDTGVGIDPEYHDMIFDPFAQAGGCPAGNQEGTGLGLAVTKELVELHGGRIWVESEKGKGSRFAFRIPAWARNSMETAGSEATGLAQAT